jgi:polyisoprenoid-binding protein YceI
MPLSPGTHRLGPEGGSLQVNTYREGMAAKAGHDLVIEVTRWEATVEVAPDGGAISAISLTADPRSLEVREGGGGVKPLTDKDREDIRKTIDDKVLRGQPIAFRSTHVEPPRDDGRFAVQGELTIGGQTHPVTAELSLGADGQVTGTISVTQSEWGIKPYRGLMGALKVRDALDIAIDARLPTA